MSRPKRARNRRKAGTWNFRTKVNITRNYTEAQFDVKEALKNKTLRVTVPTVSKQKPMAIASRALCQSPPALLVARLIKTNLHVMGGRGFTVICKSAVYSTRHCLANGARGEFPPKFLK